MEQRAAIRFFVVKESKAKKIHAELESVVGTDARQFTTVKKWRARFL
jgi:hypothetical protein